MKLYIWTDFCPDYTGGLAFAIAKNEKEAKEMIIKDCGYDPSNWGDLEIRSTTSKFSEHVTGGS